MYVDVTLQVTGTAAAEEAAAVRTEARTEAAAAVEADPTGGARTLKSHNSTTLTV